MLSDSPESADSYSFSVENGDVILVATDGVFDNVPKDLILQTLKNVEGETDAVKLQMTANSIALMARSLSFDSEFMSPFAINARKNNIHTIGKSEFDEQFFFQGDWLSLFLPLFAVGGKPDDITVVLACVALWNDLIF